MFNTGFPPEWSTLKKLVWLVGSGIVGAAAGIWKTVSGSLIHITDALASPMRKCEVTLEPIQDLHGQDAPYPAGGGINKLDDSTYTSLIATTFSNHVFTGTETIGNTQSAFVRIYKNGATVKTYDVNRTKLVVGQRTSFTISFNDTFDSFDIGYRLTSSNNCAVRYANNFPDGTYTISFLVDAIPVANTTAGKFSYVQIEQGETATPWKPYSNICPITGWTGCEVTRTGKNLLEPKFYNGGAYNGDVGRQFTFTEDTSVVKTGNVYSKSVGGWGGVTLVSSLLKVGMYKINIAISAPSVRSTLYVFDKDFRVLFKANTTNPQTWSNTIGLHEDGYIAVYLASSTEGTITFTEPQIEIGETFTGYEEYSGTTLSVTFPAEAGTVYGGTLDVVSGVLTVDKAKTTVGNLSWDYYNTAVYTTIQGKKAEGVTQKSNIICDLYKAAESVDSLGSANTWENNTIRGSITRNPVYIKDTRYTSASAFKAACSDVEIVYELATPITYQLTPQEISTLAGENNVWSNSNGDTTIIYKAQAS